MEDGEGADREGEGAGGSQKGKVWVQREEVRPIRAGKEGGARMCLGLAGQGLRIGRRVR